MSIHSLSNEMDIDGQRNQAYEEDSCDSIDSLSDTTDTESSAAEDFNTEETKEVQFRQTEPTYNSPNQERSLSTAYISLFQDLPFMNMFTHITHVVLH